MQALAFTLTLVTLATLAQGQFTCPDGTLDCGLVDDILHCCPFLNFFCCENELRCAADCSAPLSAQARTVAILTALLGKDAHTSDEAEVTYYAGETSKQNDCPTNMLGCPQEAGDTFCCPFSSFQCCPEAYTCALDCSNIGGGQRVKDLSQFPGDKAKVTHDWSKVNEDASKVVEVTTDERQCAGVECDFGCCPIVGFVCCPHPDDGHLCINPINIDSCPNGGGRSFP